MSKKILCLLLFSGIVFFHTSVYAESSLFVRRMVPEGTEVKPTDKIVFEFSEPVVSLGKMERSDNQVPIDIKPRLNCQWRWLNQSSLGCFLSSNDGLKPSTSYQIDVLKGFTALSGAQMASKQSFVLETVRPEINPSYSRFIRFVNPERPQWKIYFNTAAEPESVQKHIFFKVGDKRVEVRVTQEQCQTGKKDCFTQYFVEPVEDLGIDRSYELRYEAGFKSVQGGSLDSRKEGVIGRAKTLPAFKAEALQCYAKDFSLKSYTPQETRANPPECLFDYPVNIVLSGETVLENVGDFLKTKPLLSIQERPQVSNLISMYAPQAESFYSISLSDQLIDVWGSPLQQPVEFFFRSGSRSPQLDLPYSSVVLESGEKTRAVGYATNLNQVKIDFKGFDAQKSISGSYDIPEISSLIKNEPYPFDYGIRSMLNDKTGFIAGTVKSVPELSGNYVFTASVTPWQVVAKIGWKNSLVWVVDLKTGKPVREATVELSARPLFSSGDHKEQLQLVRTDETGRAVLKGYEKFDPEAKFLNQWEPDKDFLFLTVSKGNDIAVLPLKNEFSLSAGSLSDWAVYSVYSPEPYLYLRAFGFTPQGVYRPEDTVDFKIYVRQIDNEGKSGKAPASGYDLMVTDSSGKSVYEQKNLSLSEFGVFDGGFSLPSTAPSGWYNVVLKYKDASLYPIRFLVSDFSAPSFKSSTEIDSGVVNAKEKVEVVSRASLFSGGAYAKAKMRQSAVLSFASFSVKVGDKDFSFNPDLSNEDYASEILIDQEGSGDEKGELRQTFILPVSEKPHGKIRFETKVFDDSGRSVSSFAVADYFAVDRLVGLRNGTETAVVGKPVDMEYVVVDPRKKLVAGVPVNVVFSRKINKLIREKSAGNAYLMKYVQEDQKVAECMGMSATEIQKCSFIPEKSGLYKATAIINGYSSDLMFYVDGSDYVPWAFAENRLKIVPDKKVYQTGDTITLTVENPVPGAQALITVERYGVLESFVQKLDQSVDQIKIPVKPDFFPGVYLSVAVFSQRVEPSGKSSSLDLGKPAQWTGYLKVAVEDPSNRIKVDIRPSKKEYRPGEKMTVQINASVQTQTRPPIEAAVVVVDEAVLSLLPDGVKRFDPYEGLNKLGSLDVRTYSLIQQLIGRQSVEKKGADQGGDGGSDFAVRDVFKFVGYFNPSIKLDANGTGSFEMTMPDNLTGWKIIVLAVSPEDLSGMGQAEVTVTRPLEIRALLPNRLRTGDIFYPAVSVFNRTNRDAVLTVSMQAEGDLVSTAVDEKQMRLQAFERKKVTFSPVKAYLKPEEMKGAVSLIFKADDGENRDALKQRVDVLNLTTQQTAALFGSAEAGKTEIPVDVPSEIEKYAGDLSVSVSCNVLNGVTPVLQAMRDYPYPCWEQKISRAIAASVYVDQQNAIGSGVWDDARKFVSQMLDQAASYQAPNGGMTYFVARNDLVSPYLSAYTAYAFDFLERHGYSIPQQVKEKLTAYLSDFFKRTDDSTDRKTVLTTRLLSAAFLKRQGVVKEADIMVFDRSVPLMTAFDKALYLQLNPDNPLILKDLMNQSHQTSGSLVFKETGQKDYTLLSSSSKTTCMALLAVSDIDLDMAERLMRGAYTLRTPDGTWENTQANAFCLMGLQTYAKKAQSGKIDLDIQALFDRKELLSASCRRQSDPAFEKKISLLPDQAGKKDRLELNAKGQGRYYYSTNLSYPSDLNQSVNAGIELKREYFVYRNGAYVPLERSDSLKQGENVKVTLTLNNPVPQYFIALTDPVAGAFEPVNALLAISSQSDQERVQDQDGTFIKDIGHDFVGFYAQYLPAGVHQVSYLAQVVCAGEFTAFPAKAEAMYTPDIFGLTARDMIKVEP